MAEQYADVVVCINCHTKVMITFEVLNRLLSNLEKTGLNIINEYIHCCDKLSHRWLEKNKSIIDYKDYKNNEYIIIRRYGDL